MNSTPLRNILVLRFSAMGDVALLAPVLRSFLFAYPSHQITVATRPKFSSFLQGQERLNCFPADVDSVYSGFVGLFRIFFDLKKTNPEIVFDLHDHIRSRLICFLFRLTGTKVVRFNKGRTEKSKLTRKKNKTRLLLPHTVERYAEPFSRIGLPFKILSGPHFIVPIESENKVVQWLSAKGLKKNETWLGLAPFAAHKSKIWPLENYAGLIDQVCKKQSVKFFLFGGGKKEVDFFEGLVSQFPDTCVMVAGQLKLHEELALLRKLDKMICVDSSNMHLAALVGIPTLSIWGGTHPGAGFGPFGNENEVKVQVDVTELPCRPCSVYGTETCHRGDFACLTRVKVEDVANMVI
jgi:ADP-heptose:LPS heptosyltransferase